MIEDNAKLNIVMADLITVTRNVYRVCDSTKLKIHIQHFVQASSSLDTSIGKESDCINEPGGNLKLLYVENRNGILPF